MARAPKGTPTSYRCCHPFCPGYDFKASDRPHPCGEIGSEAEKRAGRAMRFDTRPNDRRNRAHRKWIGLRSRVARMMWNHRRNKTPTLAEVSRAIEDANRAWTWYLRWDLACHRGEV